MRRRGCGRRGRRAQRVVARRRSSITKPTGPNAPRHTGHAPPALDPHHQRRRVRAAGVLRMRVRHRTRAAAAARPCRVGIALIRRASRRLDRGEIAPARRGRRPAAIAVASAAQTSSARSRRRRRAHAAARHVDVLRRGAHLRARTGHRGGEAAHYRVQVVHRLEHDGVHARGLGEAQGRVRTLRSTHAPNRALPVKSTIAVCGCSTSRLPTGSAGGVDGQGHQVGVE